jgi:hypothetical protein
MADKPDTRDSLARTVDRLLKQLPGADPTLRGDVEPGAQRAPGATTGPTAAARPPGLPPVTRRRSDPTPAQVWGVWGRAALGLAFGVALTQWPYATDCGWPVVAYLAVVGVLLLTAGWTATAAWRFRVAGAHVLGLVVAFWGVVLAAEQILPRVGYAAESRTWRCGGVGVRAPHPLPSPGGLRWQGSMPDA